jgi:uncharacterized membrane protein YhaH (DUF805 family)
MKRVLLFTLSWFLILGAMFGLSRAIGVLVVLFSEDDAFYVLSNLHLWVWQNSWLGKGIAIALVLGIIALPVIGAARRAPKTIHFKRFFFGISDRAERKEWWLALLFWGATALLMIGIIDLVDFLMPSEKYFTIYSDRLQEWMGAPRWIRETEKAFFSLWLISGMISMVLVSVRRAHDRDRSGWWLIPMYALAPWAIVELGFLLGTEGDNWYGSRKTREDWN